MASYGILSASQALNATTANDTITMKGVGATNLSAQTIEGAAGNDVISFAANGITGVVTASATMVKLSGAITGHSKLIGSATYTFTGLATDTAKLEYVGTASLTADAGMITAKKIVARGQTGNDTIIFGDKLKVLDQSFIGGGKGNDYIGVGTFINGNFGTAAADSLSGASAVASTIYGGEGRDTINLKGAGLLTAVEINGHTDNDSIIIQSATLSNTYVGAGKGNDAISGEFTKITTSSIIGGQGKDTLSLNDIKSGVGIVVAGDNFSRSVTEGAGADSIYLSGSILTSTILGGGGNDSLTLAGLGGASGNKVYMDAGNDLISAASTTNDITNTTFYMGAGNDKFNIAQITGAKIGSGAINLGKGADTVSFSTVASQLTATELAGLTINGGAGADYLLGGGVLTDGDTAEPIIQFTTSTDSTISAFDTVVAQGAKSGSYVFNYVPAGAARGTFSGNGATATNGDVVFSGTFDASLTARAEFISTNAGGQGKTFGFEDGAGSSYLFVKGSTDTNNLVVQIGSANISGGARSLTINDGNRILVDLG
jgi:hypothetical protein